MTTLISNDTTTETTTNDAAETAAPAAPVGKNGKPRVAKPKATKVAKPAKEKGPDYPFLTKKQVIAKLEEDDAYVRDAVAFLAKQTATGEPKKGFMASQKVKGLAIAASDLDDPANLAEARALALRYSRQLAERERHVAMEANPSLREIAALFSAA